MIDPIDDPILALIDAKLAELEDAYDVLKISDEDRIKALETLLARVNTRNPGTISSAPPDPQDERRVKALQALLAKVRMNATEAPAPASSMRPPEQSAAMAPRSPNRFPEPPVAALEPLPPDVIPDASAFVPKPAPQSGLPESTAPEGRRILAGFGEPSPPAPKPRPKAPPAPKEDPRIAVLKRLFRKHGTPENLARLLEPELNEPGLGGWPAVLALMKQGETEVEFLSRYRQGEDLADLARRQFRKPKLGSEAQWLKGSGDPRYNWCK